MANDMLHVICTRLCSGHLSVRVGDSSRCSEVIVKISNFAFQFDHCHYYLLLLLLLLAQIAKILKEEEDKLKCDKWRGDERQWMVQCYNVKWRGDERRWMVQCYNVRLIDLGKEMLRLLQVSRISLP